MSSCSEKTVHAPKESRERNLLTHLLGGIAQECSAIGNAISKVGDDLSGALTAADMTRVMLECQAFDKLSQIAHAQARLIEHVGRLLMTGGPASSDDLISAIEGVPTFEVRKRLCEAIGAAKPPDEHPAAADPLQDDHGLF